MIKPVYFATAAALCLGACNSVYIKPNVAMEPGARVHAIAGGYGMRRSIKERMEARGYDITVGKNRQISGDENYQSEKYELDPSVKYVVKVDERQESYLPWWCLFNGIWWWNFNVSIAEQRSGTELMTWRGRGCAHSSLRKLDRILDQLEGDK